MKHKDLLPNNSPSKNHHRTVGGNGYSLIEILVVLGILGALTVASAAYRVDRKGPAVKGAMNSLHACLAQAQKMAKGAGQEVSFAVSGTGSAIVLGYSTPDRIIGPAATPTTLQGLSEQYKHDAGANIARFCLVESDVIPEPAQTALATLFQTLQNTAVSGGSVFKDAQDWSSKWVNIFRSPGDLKLNTSGIVNKNAYAVIVGTTNGVRSESGPVGVVLFTAPGSIFRYYCPDATAPQKWVRL